MKLGRSPEQVRILHNVYGDMKVVEAKANLLILPNSDDVSKAERNNICKCVFAQASRRLYGSRAVVFFKSVAYVDLPNANGIREVNRFTISSEMARAIVKFDKTGEARPGGFVLRLPCKSKTLQALRVNDAKKRNKPGFREKRKKAEKEYFKRRKYHRKSVLMGLAVSNHQIDKTIDGPVGYVRNGMGMAHFITEKIKETRT